MLFSSVESEIHQTCEWMNGWNYGNMYHTCIRCHAVKTFDVANVEF